MTLRVCFLFRRCCNFIIKRGFVEVRLLPPAPARRTVQITPPTPSAVLPSNEPRPYREAGTGPPDTTNSLLIKTSNSSKSSITKKSSKTSSTNDSASAAGPSPVKKAKKEKKADKPKPADDSSKKEKSPGPELSKTDG